MSSPERKARIETLRTYEPSDESNGDSSENTKEDVEAKPDTSTTKKSPRRNGVPPKPLASSNQTAASTPSPAAKQTISHSASRTSLGGSFGKPPNRAPIIPPRTSASVRRPATGVTASSVAGHKPRSSGASIDTYKSTVSKPVEERNQPALGSNAKQGATTDQISSTSLVSKPEAALRRHRSTLSLEAKTGNRLRSAPTDGANSTKRTHRNVNVASTSKPASILRPLPDTRPSDLSTPGKAAERVPGSVRKKPGSASAPTSLELSASQSKPTTSSEELSRPVLGAHRSIMSITIEQRLREMEVVNQMLQAAKADNGDEDGSVKEEYGKKADETLASSKAKLEEAKRNDARESDLPHDCESAQVVQAEQTHLGDQQNLRRALEDCQQKLSTANAELAAAHAAAEVHRAEIRELSQEPAALARDREIESLQEVIESLQDEILQADADDRKYETLRMRLIREHDKDINDLRKQHAEALQVLHETAETKLDEAQKLNDQLLSVLRGISNENAGLKEAEDFLRKGWSTSIEELQAKLSSASKKHDQELEVLRTNHLQSIRDMEASLESKYDDQEESLRNECDYLSTSLSSVSMMLKEREDEIGKLKENQHALLDKVKGSSKKLLDRSTQTAAGPWDASSEEFKAAQWEARLDAHMINLSQTRNMLHDHVERSKGSPNRHYDKSAQASAGSWDARPEEAQLPEFETTSIEYRDNMSKLQKALADGEVAVSQHTNEVCMDELKAIQIGADGERELDAELMKKITELTNRTNLSTNERNAFQTKTSIEREDDAKPIEMLEKAAAEGEESFMMDRDIKAVLKTMTAEPAVYQTQDSGGSKNANTMPPGVDQIASRLADPFLPKYSLRGGSLPAYEEHEGLLPSIEGNIAGMSEQIRQMESLNQEMIEAESKMVTSLSNALC